MVRVLLETSLPAHTLRRVAEHLEPGRLPAGVLGRFGNGEQMAGCESPARGGDEGWTPCWISLETEAPDADFSRALREVRAAVVAAAQEGGVRLFAIGASAQVGEGFYRVRDLMDVVDHLG